MRTDDELLCAPRPWQEWEDVPAGMWTDRPVEPLQVEGSRAVLSHAAGFEALACRMIAEWPVSACAHLSDRRRGRRAWVGQATCCWSHGATRWETIEAWMAMPRALRDAANDAALNVILWWEDEARKGAQLALFP